MSTEANIECDEYYKQPKSLITLSGSFLKSGETNLTSLMMYNLTRKPYSITREDYIVLSSVLLFSQYLENYAARN